jgi:hypothetical protein
MKFLLLLALLFAASTKAAVVHLQPHGFVGDSIGLQQCKREPAGSYVRREVLKPIRSDVLHFGLMQKGLTCRQQERQQ